MTREITYPGETGRKVSFGGVEYTLIGDPEGKYTADRAGGCDLWVHHEFTAAPAVTGDGSETLLVWEATDYSGSPDMMELVDLDTPVGLLDLDD